MSLICIIKNLEESLIFGKATHAQFLITVLRETDFLPSTEFVIKILIIS
jgi:hypothetical protein